MRAILLNLFLLFFLQNSFGQYQNFSGLKNKRLGLINVSNTQRFNDLQKELPNENGLPTWPPRGVFAKSQSKIDSVIVLDDAAQQLILLVYFSKINGYGIKATASSNKINIVKELASASLTVNDGQSPLELTIKSNLPENTDIQSSQLKVQITDPKHIEPTKEYVYSLNKRWNRQLNLSKLKQVLVLNPVESANELWQQNTKDTLTNSTTATDKTQLKTNKKTSKSSNTNDIFNDKNKEKLINKNETSQLLKKSSSTNPTGPSNFTFSIWDYIKTDVDFGLGELSNIKTEIFADKNPNSETFYISPLSYNLQWLPTEGYKDFSIIYGANSDVQFHASLTAGISTKQLDMFRYLIKRIYKSQGIELANPKLNLLGANSTPIVSLSGGFNGVFQIDPSRVSVTAPADFTNPLTISFSTDNKTKDMITLAMQNGIGLNGNYSVNSDSIKLQIPINISFNNKKNYGKIIISKETWRNIEWQNIFPYPIKIKYLHALFENEYNSSTSINHIYSWQANNNTIPPNSKITFDASRIPTWIDDNPKVILMWLEYDTEECADCTQQIISNITKAISGNSTANLHFQSMDLITELKASQVQVRVKSIQADPTKNKEFELSKTILKDGEEITIGPFYIGIDNRIDYQYKLVIISNQAPIETNWFSETNKQLYLNKAGIERLIGRPLK